MGGDCGGIGANGGVIGFHCLQRVALDRTSEEFRFQRIQFFRDVVLAVEIALVEDMRENFLGKDMLNEHFAHIRLIHHRIYCVLGVGEKLIRFNLKLRILRICRVDFLAQCLQHGRQVGLELFYRLAELGDFRALVAEEKVEYAINLKREFPRIPFYPDFWAWAEWGKRLMELHIGYETVKPWPVNRHDQPPGDADPIPKLKADKDNGTITLDSFTTLSGIPPSAWEYRLGNRSGLEWILDQYKEKKPKDPTIAAKFNTYRFMDYKEKVIDLLSRVTRVSVETMEIVNAMKAAKRD